MSAGWVGARELLAALAAAGIAAAAGCGGGSSPHRLAEGSPAATLSLELEGVRGPALLTGVRSQPPGQARKLASCLARMGGGRVQGQAVVRVGVSGSSVTVRERGGHRLLGCDRAARGGGGRSWCGTPVGRIEAGRLTDPRLNLGCRSPEGRPLAFAWIEPPPGTRYLVAQQEGYAEVYEFQGGLPVRVTTDDVRAEAGIATFRLSAHDARGRLLRRWTAEVAVAG